MAKGTIRRTIVNITRRGAPGGARGRAQPAGRRHAPTHVAYRSRQSSRRVVARASDCPQSERKRPAARSRYSRRGASSDLLDRLDEVSCYRHQTNHSTAHDSTATNRHDNLPGLSDNAVALKQCQKYASQARSGSHQLRRDARPPHRSG